MITVLVKIEERSKIQAQTVIIIIIIPIEKTKIKKIMTITSQTSQKKVATCIKGSINKPLQFIDKLEPGDRIALFYEEPEYARMLLFHYLRIGLISGERCIYLVADKIQMQHQVGEEQNNDEKKKSNKDIMISNNNNNSELEFI